MAELPHMQAVRTTDHDTIRKWIEERGGRPSVLRVSWNGTSGMLRIDFDGQDRELEEIPWSEFFRILEENELAFLYQEETPDGQRSRFCRFIEREFVSEP